MNNWSGSINIRPAKPSDARLLHACVLRLAEALDQAEKVTSAVYDFAHYGFGPTAAFHGLIAETEDGECAGICLFFPIFSTWLGKPGVYIQDLFVEGAQRGAGVGERLIRATASWSQARGGAYLRLSVDVRNNRAQAFYERLGIAKRDDEQEHGAYGDAFSQLASDANRKI